MLVRFGKFEERREEQEKTWRDWRGRRENIGLIIGTHIGVIDGSRMRGC